MDNTNAAAPGTDAAPPAPAPAATPAQPFVAKKAAPFDLGQFTTVINETTEEGAWCPLKNPATGALLDIRIRVKALDSESSLELLRRTQNRRLRQGVNIKLTSEELLAESIDTISALTIGWESAEGNVITWNGAPITCNRENARTLYREANWIRKQVESFANDMGNFLGNSETPSSISPAGSGI